MRLFAFCSSQNRTVHCPLWFYVAHKEKHAVETPTPKVVTDALFVLYVPYTVQGLAEQLTCSAQRASCRTTLQTHLCQYSLSFQGCPPPPTLLTRYRYLPAVAHEHICVGAVPHTCSTALTVRGAPALPGLLRKGPALCPVPKNKRSAA